MRRLIIPLAVGLVMTWTATACRQYLPSNRYLRPRRVSATHTTADARGKFDHRAHAAPLADANVVCADCHRFDVVIETTNEEMAGELSMRAQHPGSAVCHYCHRASETAMATAPKACTTCHENLVPLRPPDHEVAWSKVHAAMARAEPARCGACHRQADCIDCHQRRDTIQTRVHDRNFRFFHSVQVRANPMQCGSCHREDFCIRCHQQGNVKRGS